MEYGYSIIMGIFSLTILLYAGLMALTKDYKILPYRSRQSVKPKDPKKYTLYLSKIVALTALAPALSALTGLWNIAVAFIVLIVAFVLLIWLGIKKIKQ